MGGNGKKSLSCCFNSETIQDLAISRRSKGNALIFGGTKCPFPKSSLIPLLTYRQVVLNCLQRKA